jgi:hypothetical protein
MLDQTMPAEPEYTYERVFIPFNGFPEPEHFGKNEEDRQAGCIAIELVYFMLQLTDTAYPELKHMRKDLNQRLKFLNMSQDEIGAALRVCCAANCQELQPVNAIASVFTW